MEYHVLVIEDDATMSEMLRLYLQNDGYQVTTARDGREGLNLALQGQVDLILLDVMLPNMMGWEICGRIRQQSRVPIILLTVLDQEEHKVKGLDLGADDYVTKPFSMKELLARVRARLRVQTGKPLPIGKEGPHLFPNLIIDPAGRTVRLAEQPLELTPKEFDLLVTLVRHTGQVLTREELITRVWRYPAGTDTHTLRTHMVSLRRKLEAGGCRYLHTVWGVGYKFEVQP